MAHDDIDTLCMKIAVELEIVDAIGLVTTRTIGNTIREQIEPFLRSRIAALEAENAELKQRVETAERDANQADDDKDCVELVATEVQAELAALEKRLADAEAALREAAAALSRFETGSAARKIAAYFASAAQPKDKESGG